MKYQIETTDKWELAIVQLDDQNKSSVPNSVALYELADSLRFKADQTRSNELLTDIEHGKLYYTQGKRSNYLLADKREDGLYFIVAESSGKPKYENKEALKASEHLFSNIRQVKNQPKDLPC